MPVWDVVLGRRVWFGANGVVERSPARIAIQQRAGIAAVAAGYCDARMKSISVKLPEGLARWLNRESATRRRSRSEIVREALEERRQGPGAPSMADVLGDLAGTIDGPRDLSVNPRHLDGLGR